MQRQIFRQVALERLSSPEQLDQLMQVTSPRGWLALLAILGLIITIVGWSFSDRIPSEVLGRGILLRGGRVYSVAASDSGQVAELLVRAGDSVAAGQVIARIRRPDSQGLAELTSPYAGRVISVSIAAGAFVSAGAPALSLEDAGAPLEAVIYMPPEVGKNVQVGMPVQVSPVNLNRAEYGFIYGNVRSVASFPSTFESMMLVLGNEALAREFLSGSTPIEVRIDLTADPATPSGYRWSSSPGAPLPIDSGTLCTATITLDEQRPINLVFPTR